MEFTIEFMLERENYKKPTISNVDGDQNIASGYLELKGLLSINHTGSESELDVSPLATRETRRVKEFGKEGYETENKSHNDTASVVPHAPLGNGNRPLAGHGHFSAEKFDNSTIKMKFLCSFGGKILPRPSDGKLRYVGGDTRIIRLKKDISWQELKHKTSLIYNEAHTIKYQLLREDLDSLVSISCDEDLQNMMEECSVLEGGEGSNKLRLFLFSTSELEGSHYGLGRRGGDSEVQYVVAINGMDITSRESFRGLDLSSKSATDIGHLFDLNVRADKGIGRVQTASNETTAAPSVGITLPSSATLSSIRRQERHLNDPGLVSQESVIKPVDPLREKSPTTEDTLMQVKKHKDLADAATQEDLEFENFSHDACLLQWSETILNPYLEEISNDDRRKLKGPRKEPFVGEGKTAGLEHPSSVIGTTIRLQEDPTYCLPEHQDEIGANINNDMGHLPPFAWVGSSAGAGYREESSLQDSAPKRGDIIIDINDRFPPDLLLDMFNDARTCDLATGASPLCKNESGLSLNMQNNESNCGLFFQNLPQDEFAQKGISLVDEDCIVSSPLTRVEEGAPGTYDLSPLNCEGLVKVDLESQIVVNEGISQTLSIGADAGGLCHDNIPSWTIPANLHDNRDEVIRVEDTPFSKMGDCPSPDSEVLVFLALVNLLI